MAILLNAIVNGDLIFNLASNEVPLDDLLVPQILVSDLRFRNKKSDTIHKLGVKFVSFFD